GPGRPTVLSGLKPEARLLLKLRHPNIVRAFQVGESAGLHYLVMEYLEGETLEDVMARRKAKFLPGEAVRLIHQALQGLQHIHQQGLGDPDPQPGHPIPGPRPRPPPPLPPPPHRKLPQPARGGGGPRRRPPPEAAGRGRKGGVGGAAALGGGGGGARRGARRPRGGLPPPGRPPPPPPARPPA